VTSFVDDPLSKLVTYQFSGPGRAVDVQYVWTVTSFELNDL